MRGSGHMLMLPRCALAEPVVHRQPSNSEDVRLDPAHERLQRRASRADLIGERRQGERHALSCIAFGLTVQRLMLAELLEQRHGHEVRTGPAARRDVERRHVRAPLARTTDCKEPAQCSPPLRPN